MSMPGPALPPFGAATLTIWVWHPWWTLALLIVGVGYALLARHAYRLGVGLAAWRLACFGVGEALLLATPVSGCIGTYAMSLFWVHMIEHLILIMVVPALLVLGQPLVLLDHATGSRMLEVRVVNLVLHPLVALGGYSLVIIGTHLTGFMDAMTNHPALMTAEQVTYVLSGWLLIENLWGSTRVARLPYAGRFLLTLISMVPDTLVGIVLLQGQAPDPTYLAMRPSWAPDAHLDTQIAGGLMWAAGDGLMMLLGLGIIVAALRQGGRNLLGTRLEAVRTATFAAHLEAAGIDPDASGSDRLDDDQAALDAYNQMLARLSGKPTPRT